ncbi:MAG: hypothetical protein AB8B71_17360 [Paracoccaceae bacterium]
MKTKIIMITAAALLAACENTPPVVSEFNGDSVTIQTNELEPRDYQLRISQEEATRICGKVGKKAEYASTRPAGPYSGANSQLYLCL